MAESNAVQGDAIADQESKAYVNYIIGPDDERSMRLLRCPRIISIRSLYSRAKHCGGHRVERSVPALRFASPRRVPVIVYVSIGAGLRAGCAGLRL